MYMCNFLTVHLKLTQHCESTIFYENLKYNNKK